MEDAMGVWESQWEAFYGLCDADDQAILDGTRDMQMEDYERLTYIAFLLGYIEVLQTLLDRYPDLTDASIAQFERTVDILTEYPEYMQEEALGEKYDRWMKEFLKRVPEEEKAHLMWQLDETF